MRHPMSPRDHWEPKDHHQAVESRLNQNRSERSVEDIANIAQEAEVHIKDEAQTEEEISFKTTDATTATNQTLRENIWIDVRQRELRANFVINLDITKLPVEGSAEISEDGEQSE